jgi:DNA-binding CsgD family transcriptional regulator
MTEVALMPGRSASSWEVASEVTRIASMPASPQERAEALLEPLRRVVPFAGAWLSLLDPELREQPPLVSYGYPDALTRYGSGPAGVAEIERLGLQRRRGAFRHGDLDLRAVEFHSWREYLAPAGFRGGLSAALVTPDGRYLGVLALTTDTADHPTPAARDLIGAISSTIAWAVDPMRLISAAAMVIHDAQAAVVLTRAGSVLPVPGLPGHPLLDEGSAVLAVAAPVMAAHGDYATFLCPRAAGDSPGEVRVTVLGCAEQPPHYLTCAVVVSPPGDTHGLNQAELEILGQLIEDWPIRRIAVAMAADEREVRAAVTSIQDKLAAPSCAVATMRALRQGTYIPVGLSRTRL